MDKILILDGESTAATECVLALTPGREVHLATPSGRSCFSARRVARTFCQPSSPEALRDWTEELFRREGYQLVVPSTEVSLYALKSRDLGAALRASAVIPSEESIDVALNKLRTIELARQLGVPVPHSRLITAGPTQTHPRYPVVIKPLCSKLPVQGEIRSFGAHICPDAQSRSAACAEILPHTDALEQEYFRGSEVGIEMLFENGRLRWWFAHERVHALPVTGGVSTYRRSIEPPEALLRAAETLLTRLCWHGVAMVEFKASPDGDYRLLEINPRLWGSLPLAIAAGVNFPCGLLSIARGETLGPQPRYRRGLYMRNLASDLIWFVQSWRERRNPLRIKPLQAADIWNVLRPLIGSERWDFFRWRDPGPWWASTRSTLASARGEQRRHAARHATTANWSKLKADWHNVRLQRVLVLCHGNICRSPAVEHLLSAAGLEAKSAGFLPAAGRAPPADWVRVAKNVLAIDLRDHRSKTVKKDMIEWADLILLMDAANWRALLKTVPSAAGKAVLLGAIARGNGTNSFEIPDPYLLDDHAMQKIALAIKSCVQGLLDQRADMPATSDPA